MKNFDFKGPAILFGFCSLIGVGVQYFTGFYWLSASLILLVVLLIHGMIIYNEDLEEGGFDHQKGVTDTPDARVNQRKVNLVQLTIIMLLIVAAIFSLL